MPLTTPSNPTPQGRHEAPNIVVVDDNPSVLERVHAMLEGEFHVLGTADNGRATLTLIARFRPDVVILDITLGETSGIDLARELRARGFEGKIVFLSIHDDPDYVSAAFSAGGTAYVTKPSMGSDLALAIRAVLEERSFVSTSTRLS